MKQNQQINFNQILTKKLNKYLRDGNQNLNGTILAIQKSIFQDKTSKPGYAILLYFDHSTARIERYLYNPNYQRELLQFDFLLDKTLDLKQENNKQNELRIHVFEDLLTRYVDLFTDVRLYLHSDYKTSNNMNDKEIEEFYAEYENLIKHNLLDGKLNSRFYQAFYIELIYSYILHKTHYKFPDMTLIKYLEKGHLLMKKPSDRFWSLTDKGIKARIGEPFQPIEYFKHDNKHPKQIYIPMSFTTNLKANIINEFNKKYNIKLIPTKLGDCPKVIKDLKSYVNFNNINDYTDLQNHVDLANIYITKKIYEIKDSIQI